jgi:hypothetical protein
MQLANILLFQAILDTGIPRCFSPQLFLAPALKRPEAKLPLSSPKDLAPNIDARVRILTCLFKGG